MGNDDIGSTDGSDTASCLSVGQVTSFTLYWDTKTKYVPTIKMFINGCASKLFNFYIHFKVFRDIQNHDLKIS